jgi:L-galactose dehydrogenase/L-glyceraldehyde 3-phosphate reductase
VESRSLGKTGLTVSALGFGCGNVGGLIIRGTPAERERGVARAMELGVNYFDTAPSYGDGESERNLGQVLKTLRARVYVGTKFRLDPRDAADIPAAIGRSLDASLRRLGMERVDLLQLHNRIEPARGAGAVSLADVLGEVVPTVQKLRQQGKVGFCGITALGETTTLHRAFDSGAIDTAQVCYNLLNPSAGVSVPPGFPAQDFAGLLGRARQRSMGVIVIRALAAGALSGVETRHPVAVPSVDPIATAPDYRTDVARAQLLGALVREGHASSLIEASLRLAVGSDAVSTVLVGYSSIEHLEEAAAAVNRGPLPRLALDRLSSLWSELAGR